MGIWLIARKKAPTTLPLTPGPVKYSDLARKYTWRGTATGMNTESEIDRWLLAKMAAPWEGTFSRPMALGRYTVFTTGPTT